MNKFTPKDEELIRKIGWSYPLVIELYEAYLEQVLLHYRIQAYLVAAGVCCALSLVWNIILIIKLGG